MAAADSMAMSSSLAVVQASGALPLDLWASREEPNPLRAEQFPATPPPADHTPCASPYTASAYTCGSPMSIWSPATPAVMASGTNAFGMPVGGHVVQSPTAMILSSAQPTMLPGIRAAGAGPVVVMGSPALLSPVRKSSVIYVRSAAGGPSSPAAFGNMALSPGATIQRNAASFGIPLNLRATTTEVSAPVPIRTGAAGGGVLAPSPTARTQGMPIAVQSSPFGFSSVPAMPGASGAGQHPFTRPICTPLTRRAAGGA